MNKTKIKAEISGKDTNVIVNDCGVETMHRIYDMQDTNEAIRLYKLNSHLVCFIGSFTYCD